MFDALILDGAIIFLFLTFFIIGSRRGIMKSLLSLINIALSLVVSIYVSALVSENIYNQFIKSNLIKQINISLETKNPDWKATLSNLPEFISKSFEHYGITEDSLTHIINSKMSNTADQIEKIISPIFVQTVKVAVQMALFFILLLILSLLSKVMLALFNFKIVRPIDSSIGAVLGLVSGYFIITIVLFVIRIGIQITSFAPGIFSYDNIESTYIFRHMYTGNLLTYDLK